MHSPDTNEEFVSSDSGSPLVSWKDVHPNLLAPVRSPVRENTDLTTLLSASFYRHPGQSTSQQEETSDTTHVQLYGGVLLASPSPEDDPISTSDNRNNRRGSPVREIAPSKRRRRQSSPNNGSSSNNKRGRPQKTDNPRTEEDPEERRRAQIRLAQRAYRSRKEASISSLRSQVSQLEAMVENMSESVVSFNDELVRSGALSSDSELAGHWRDTVQMCLSLAKDAGKEGEHESLKDTPSFPSEKTPSPTGYGLRKQHSLFGESPVSTVDPSLYNNRGAPYNANISALQDPDSLEMEISVIELSAFIEKLHIACIYEGYLMLRDPSVDLDSLQRPFRLLLSIIDRKRATSFFEASLHARSGLKRMDEWKEIPFFSLGGAGTHYPRKSRQNSTEAAPRWMTIEDPLSRFSQDVQHGLDGEWFDIQDLEGYLREKGVSILARPVDYSNLKSSSARAMVNAAGLLPGLLKSGVCLGRTPGFRRIDVERALHLAMCA